MAPGLQRNQAEQCFDRILQISAFARTGAIGHQPETPETDDVIDAQPTGMAQLGAQQLNERGVGTIDQGPRRVRGQAPALAERVQRVRRRADRQALQEVLWPAPAVAAAAIGADREIADQADRHAAGFRRRLRALQAQIGQPLQPQMEGDFVHIRFSECADFGTERIAKRRRPVLPVPERRAHREEVRLQRFKTGVIAQAGTALGNETSAVIDQP